MPKTNLVLLLVCCLLGSYCTRVICFSVSRPLSLSSSSSPTRRTASSRLATTTVAANNDEFTVGVIGDLHLDPRKLQDYQTGRQHLASIFERSTTHHYGNNNNNNNVALVSLGDLGESKAVWSGSDELFSGTTACHEMAAQFLGSFGVPYELVGGNHGTYTHHHSLLGTHSRDVAECCSCVSL